MGVQQNLSVHTTNYLSQGFVSSCVGPVVDVSLRHMPKETALALGSTALADFTGLDNNACVYDSILLVRPTCSFREGISLNNIPSRKIRYYEQLGNAALIFGLGQMEPIAYTKKQTSLRQI